MLNGDLWVLDYSYVVAVYAFQWPSHRCGKVLKWNKIQNTLLLRQKYFPVPTFLFSIKEENTDLSKLWHCIHDMHSWLNTKQLRNSWQIRWKFSTTVKYIFYLKVSWQENISITCLREIEELVLVWQTFISVEVVALQRSCS